MNSSIPAKAFLLREKGSVPKLEEIQVSDSLQPGQVLVRMLYTALCATQVEEIYVASRNAKYMPHLFGHEGVGIIEKTGLGVDHLAVGQVCVLHWRKSTLGLDAPPGDYFSNGEKLNSGKIATFSTHVVIPSNHVTLLPDGVPFELAPLLGCSLTTGWGAVMNNGKLRPGESVVVIGLGGVGSSAFRTAIFAGAKSVVGVDLENRLADIKSELVKFYNSTIEMMQSYSLDSSETFPDLVIDTTGDPKVFESLIEWLPTTARLVLVGMPKLGIQPKLNTQKLLDGLRLEGSNGGEFDPKQDLEVVARTVLLPNEISIRRQVTIAPASDFQRILDNKLYLTSKYIFKIT